EIALFFGAVGTVAALSTVAAPINDDFRAQGAQPAVFVMTNDADANEIISYERTTIGTLHDPHRYATRGRGSGGTIDPLGPQGSSALGDGGSSLLAANAGSGSLSVFRVVGSRLFLTDRVPSGGSEPNAIAQHGRLVYVLNTAGSSSVVGFRLD